MVRQEKVDELQRHKDSVSQSFRATLSECGVTDLSEFEKEMKDGNTKVKSLQDAAYGVVLAQKALDETKLDLRTANKQIDTLNRQLATVMSAFILFLSQHAISLCV